MLSFITEIHSKYTKPNCNSLSYSLFDSYRTYPIIFQHLISSQQQRKMIFMKHEHIVLRVLSLFQSFSCIALLLTRPDKFLSAKSAPAMVEKHKESVRDTLSQCQCTAHHQFDRGSVLPFFTLISFRVSVAYLMVFHCRDPKKERPWIRKEDFISQIAQSACMSLKYINYLSCL